MPGLVVVRNRPDAEATARRAAAPMLRRPWHRLSLAVTPDGTVALGFAGERGGVATEASTGRIAAFDGELYGAAGIRTGSTAAGEVLAAYHRDGVDLDPGEGRFAAALWDPDGRTLLLVADRHAYRPLQVWRYGDGLVAASELKALVAAGLRPELDAQGAADVLAYRALFLDHALLAGVQSVPGGATLVDRPQGRSIRQRWRFRVQPEAGADDGEFADELGRLLERAVVERRSENEALAMSAGLDSRCLAGILGRLGFDGVAATWAWPRSPDASRAPGIARAAGLRHRLLELQTGFASRQAARCIWLGELRKGALRSQELSLQALRGEEGATALIVGAKGDHVLRMIPPPPLHGPRADWVARAARTRSAFASGTLQADEVLAPSFAREIRGLALGSAAAVLEHEGDRLSSWVELGWQRESSTALFDDHLVPRDPFTSHELEDFCARLPIASRRAGRLQRAYLRRFGRTAWTRDPVDGVPPAARGSLEQALRAAVRLGRGARRRAAPILPRRLEGPGRAERRHALGLTPADPGVMGLLLEPRTFARGRLQEQPVRRMVAALQRGDMSVYPILSSLLGLELFERQFVDGDGDPGEPH